MNSAGNIEHTNDYERHLMETVEAYLTEYVLESRNQGTAISVEDFGIYLQNVGD